MFLLDIEKAEGAVVQVTLKLIQNPTNLSNIFVTIFHPLFHSKKCIASMISNIMEKIFGHGKLRRAPEKPSSARKTNDDT